MIKVKAGKKEIPVHFGWRQLSECNRTLKKANIHKATDLAKEDNGDISEEAIDLGLEMFESQCVIASIGIKEGHKSEYDVEISDRDVDRIIDENPEVIAQIWDHFMIRFNAFMGKAAVNPVKELQEKKLSKAAK